MKKLLTFVLVLLCSFSILCSCEENETDTVRIAVLNGTTGFGAAKMMADAKDGYAFTIESDASVIQKALIAGTVDIAALPTNAAAIAYNKTEGAVQLLAINTYGVLHVIENGDEIHSIGDLAGKTVYVPAQNPAWIAEYILSESGLTVSTEEGKESDVFLNTAYSTPALLQKAVLDGEVSLAILPEPVVSVLCDKVNGLRRAIDLSAAWDALDNGTVLVQGCLVVRREFAEKNPDTVKRFLKDYAESVNYLEESPSAAAQTIAGIKINDIGLFGGSAAVIETALPNCHVTCLLGSEMKNAMEGYLQAMYSVSPTSVGGTLPDDDFYYGI